MRPYSAFIKNDALLMRDFKKRLATLAALKNAFQHYRRLKTPSNTSGT
jgi:hypothetical protein